jgi:hypothetical protein
MKEDIPSEFYFVCNYLFNYLCFIATCVAAVFSDIEPEPQVYLFDIFTICLSFEFFS